MGDEVDYDFGPVSGNPDWAGEFDTTGQGFGGANNTGPDTGSGSFLDWLKRFAGDNKGLLGLLAGAAGPLAQLGGQLGSGGTTGQTQGSNSLSNSQSGSASSNQTGSQSGTNFQNQTGTQNSNQTGTHNSVQNTSNTGYQNTSNRPVLDPAAQATIDRLTGMFNSAQGGAQQAYGKGLSMLEQLAGMQMGQMTSRGAPSAPAAPPTTSGGGDVAGRFPTMPTQYNPALGNLIKQAFGSFVGDLGSNAITNARQRGFAGGADLLGSAAAPMMGQTLAQVPSMQAKAYLDHVLQAYSEESQNAARESGAYTNAQNAATNALGPGIAKYNADINKYGIDRSADTAQMGQTASLLQMMMDPQQKLMANNIGFLNAIPHGSDSNTLSGSQGTQTLSGNTTNQTQTNFNNASVGGNQSQSQNQTQSQNQNQSNSQGTQNNSASVPTGTNIGTGVGNIIQGAAQGYASMQDPPMTLTSLLKLLGKA